MPWQRWERSNQAKRVGLYVDPLVDSSVHPSQIGEGLMPLVEPGESPVVVLVDDAESVDDVGGVLDQLSTSDRADLLMVAAGRNDGVRAGYSHWTRPLRRSKLHDDSTDRQSCRACRVPGPRPQLVCEAGQGVRLPRAIP